MANKPAKVKYVATDHTQAGVLSNAYHTINVVFATTRNVAESAERASRKTSEWLENVDFDISDL